MSFPTILAAVAAIYWLTRRNRVRNVGYSRTMSPDTVSSLFPDRPIRPLPKRRLREQLSPEAAGSIKYPPSTHNGPVPLFHYPPYTVRDDGSPPRFSNAVFYNSPGHASESSRLFPPRRGGAGAGVIEDIDVNKRSSLVTRSSPEILNRASLQTGRSDRPLFGAPTPSATSSVDGYDSFENTSNKKKRKIPSAADSALNGAHGLMSDFSPHSTGSPGAPANDLNGDRVYSVSSGYPAPGGFVSNSQGISGSGRGRLGRTRNGRSPLRALPDANSTWSGRIPKAGTALWASGKSPLPNWLRFLIRQTFGFTQILFVGSLIIPQSALRSHCFGQHPFVYHDNSFIEEAHSYPKHHSNPIILLLQNNSLTTILTFETFRLRGRRHHFQCNRES